MKTALFYTKIQYFFLAICLLLLPFVWHTTVLDQTLLPKMMLQSILFVPILLLLVWKEKKTALPIVLVLFFAFYLWHCLSALWASNVAEVFYNGQRNYLFFLSTFLTYIILKEKDTKKTLLLKTLSLSALLCTLLGWYQFFSIEEWLSTSTTYLITGCSAHRNLFALLLFMHIPFVLLSLIWLKKQWRYPLLGVLILLLLLLFSLLARGIMLGFMTSFAIIVLLYFLFIRNNQEINLKPILLGIGAFVLALVLIFSAVGDTEMLGRYNIFNKKYSRNIEERIVLWDNTLKMVKDKPILGYGAGNWVLYFPSKGIDRIGRMRDWSKPAIRPHNDLLWILSELGIIGFILFASLIGSFIYIGIKGIQASKKPKTKWTLAILLAFCLGYIVVSAFDFPRERIEINALFGVLLAFILLYSKSAYAIPSIQLSSNAKKAFSFALLLVLAFTVYLTNIRWNGEKNSMQSIINSQKNNFDLCVKHAEAALHPLYTFDPLANPVVYYMGNACFKEKKYRESIPFYEQALTVFPYHLSSLHELGGAYAELQQYDKAVTYFEKVLEINSSYKNSLEGLGLSYYKLNRPEKVKEVLAGLDSKKPVIIQIKKELGIQ